MQIKRPFYKINFEDIDIASEFFDHNQKHLSEFIMATIAYYSGKNVEIKSKLVEKYFKTYKKTMDFVMLSKGYGKKGALVKAENQIDNNQTLQGVVEVPLAETLPTNNELLNNNNKELSEKNNFNFKYALIDSGFNTELVSDWMHVRKAKKATNTETSFNNFISQVEKSGVDKNEILKICISRDWKGFNTDWIKDMDIPKEKKEFVSNNPYFALCDSQPKEQPKIENNEPEY